MKFSALPLQGAYVIELEPSTDGRGSFSRTWCAREFAENGLHDRLVQCSISRNTRRGTVRGMHMQLPPSKEVKVVRCSQGAIVDVILDMRPDSSTYLQHCAVTLEGSSGTSLYIPHGFAHGFQTLEDHSEVLYLMGDYFAPESSVGWRWNDPTFNIEWPMQKGITIGERDATYTDFDLDEYEARIKHIKSQNIQGKTS